MSLKMKLEQQTELLKKHWECSDTRCNLDNQVIIHIRWYINDSELYGDIAELTWWEKYHMRVKFSKAKNLPYYKLQNEHKNEVTATDRTTE